MFLRASRRRRKRQAAAGTAGAAEPQSIIDVRLDDGSAHGVDDPPRLAGGSNPPPATMHPLTIEVVRMLIRISLDHADEISPKTAKDLSYCLNRMQRYARDDWLQIRDLQPLLLALKPQ